MLLRALGISHNDQITDLFGEGDFLLNTLAKDTTTNSDHTHTHTHRHTHTHTHTHVLKTHQVLEIQGKLTL